MELQGLYELHERLGAAAVAGVNLIGDDFRLRRGSGADQTPGPGRAGDKKNCIQWQKTLWPRTVRTVPAVC